MSTERDSNGLSLIEFYRGKTLLCTGCSGFLGKVLVEKILRCLPDVKKVYLLIRPKGKSTDINGRMKKEILDSPIMNHLKEKIGEKEFYELAYSKLEAVAGDVAVPTFFVDNGEVKAQQVIDRLKKEVNVIIHSAATIGFHERLDVAIELNTFGPVNAVKFAVQCENIEAVAHISTCFVNSNTKSGTKIQEKLYPVQLPGNEDIEDFCRRVMAMTPAEAEKTSDKYLKQFGFPNTYTFTKRMGEILAEKHARGRVPLAIVRPSIVGGAMKEPCAGWVDTVSAAGSVYLFVGLGILSVLPGDAKCVTDQIPVDFVVNAMLSCPVDVNARYKRLGEMYRVYHSGSSFYNPCTWQMCVTGVVNYWRMHPSVKAIAPAEFNLITSSWYYNTQFFMSYTWIRKLYSLLATWNKSHAKIAETLIKMENRANIMKKSFAYFTSNEWIFESQHVNDIQQSIVPAERDIFFLDTKMIDWNTYFNWFCYGLHKHILKEDPPLPVTSNVVSMVSTTYSSNMASDINFVYSASGDFTRNGVTTARRELMQTVMNSQAVRYEITAEAHRSSVLEAERRAFGIMDRMFADPDHRVVRMLSWTLRKVWRRLYQSININSEEVYMLKQLASQVNKKNSDNNDGHIDGFDPSSMTHPPGPLILIPTHRSYLDFLIISYIFFAYSIPVPHIAAGEDFLNMSVVRNIFRHSGAFFIRRQFGDDPLYRSIFAQYVQHLLMDGCPMEFFVEGTRSRSGKTLQPKLGLLSIIVDSFLEKKVPNLTIVPVNISYEKLIEGQAYSDELLGNAKKKESLKNLVKARNVLGNKYGDIHVKIAPPISLADYVTQLRSQDAHLQIPRKSSGVEEDSSQNNENESQESNERSDLKDRQFDPFVHSHDKNILVRRLAYKITHELNGASIIPATSLVASIVLAYRDGISLDELNRRTEWLKQLIVERGGEVSWVAGDLKEGSIARHSQQSFSTSAVVDRALGLMSDVVVKRKFMIEPGVNSRNEHKKFIQLGVYRNQLLYLFVKESIVCCAYEQQVSKLEKDASNGADKGVNVQDLLTSCKFLSSLMRHEFVKQENPDDNDNYDAVLDKMIQRGIFIKNENHVQLPLTSVETHRFMCSLLWPFIESYWAATMAVLTLLFTGSEKEQLNSVEENVLIQRTQWLAEKLFFEDKIHFYECCSLDTIKNAINTLVTFRVLSRSSRSEKKNASEKLPPVPHVHLLPPYTEMDKLFGVVQNVQNYRKASNKTLHDMMGAASRKSVFPFSPKL
ncbi:glycerone phosphate O-acyltransferase [Acrasis kona]|uniref:Glycerone phosphate O-acyltransferase n=1 Tax=Acrasis kona TaxID=1008807 RepID=A0AAW2ZFN2_9EUKA